MKGICGFVLTCFVFSIFAPVALAVQPTWDVEVDIDFSPPVVAIGDTLTVFAEVENLSDRAAVIFLTLSITKDGEELPFTPRGAIRLGAMQTRSVSVDVVIPEWLPPMMLGEYVVTVTAEIAGGKDTATDSAPLTITE
jgi:hypothetical protein